MEEIRLKARAKINLTLDVTGKRENGYHELCMIMQTVGLHDGIDLYRRPEKGISVETNLYYLPNNEQNLAYRAAALLMEGGGEIDTGGGLAHATLLVDDCDDFGHEGSPFCCGY